jgi:septum formation protein
VSRLEVILGSASPARLTTLRRAGLNPQVRVSSVDEDAVIAHYGVTDAEDVALVLAKAKAEDVAAHWTGEGLVLGCDSVLEVDGEVHGKPGDVDTARARWHAMRGRSAVLHTGHWLIDTRRGGGSVGAVGAVVVHFAAISDEELEAYLATGEPLGVAGAFTLDGLGGAFVTRIEGDPHCVVGVSVPLLRTLAGDLGVAWHLLWAVPTPL